MLQNTLLLSCKNRKHGLLESEKKAKRQKILDLMAKKQDAELEQISGRIS